MVLGGSGSLSLEAVRWLADVGAALVCIDRDGRVLCTSTPSKAEAKLRRAQALAPYGRAGVEVARLVLGQKLEGQVQLLDQLDPRPASRQALEGSLDGLQRAAGLPELLNHEAQAAAAYWRCWASQPVRFSPSDRQRLPEAWASFGSRSSRLGGSPRLAVTPAGAILNYLYALLEAETRLACLTVGLDPALAVWHADLRGRDSLPLDLMEAIRPQVDRYLLQLLEGRVFQLGEFHQTRRGSVRLLPPLTHQLAETLPAWRQLVGPVVEQVCRLVVSEDEFGLPLATPLTGGNRRADRARRHQRPLELPAPKSPQPEKRCIRCGGRLPHARRVYCNDCLPHYQRERYEAFRAAGQERKKRERLEGADPSHGGQAAARRGASRRRRIEEQHAWREANPDTVADRKAFEREILPVIQRLPLSTLVAATGLTHGYLAQVRSGRRVPHVRHWPALRTAARSC